MANRFIKTLLSALILNALTFYACGGGESGAIGSGLGGPTVGSESNGGISPNAPQLIAPVFVCPDNNNGLVSGLKLSITDVTWLHNNSDEVEVIKHVPHLIQKALSQQFANLNDVQTGAKQPLTIYTGTEHDSRESSPNGEIQTKIAIEVRPETGFTVPDPSQISDTAEPLEIKLANLDDFSHLELSLSQNNYLTLLGSQKLVAIFTDSQPNGYSFWGLFDDSNYNNVTFVAQICNYNMQDEAGNIVAVNSNYIIFKIASNNLKIHR